MDIHEVKIYLEKGDIVIRTDGDALKDLAFECMQVLHNAKPLFPYYKQIKYAEADYGGFFINAACTNPSYCYPDHINWPTIDNLLKKASGTGIEQFVLKTGYTFPNDLTQAQKLALCKKIISVFWKEVRSNLNSDYRDQYLSMWKEANNDD